MVAPTCGTYGGIETFTAEIAREVIGSGEFDVQVVFRIRPGFQVTDNLHLGLSRHEFPWRLMDKPDFRYLKDLVRADVINCHFPLLYATYPAVLLRKKLAITVENQRWPEHGQLYQKALMLGDARWYISTFVASTWEGKQFAPGSHIVPAVSELPDEWREPSTRKGFFFIARWIPKKGIEELIEAYAAADIDHQLHPLTLLGDGPLRQEIEVMIRQSAVGRFIDAPGFMSHPEKIERMANARWNVAPAAFAEDLGLSPIEARACGVPSIVSNVGGLPEAAGENALLCEPGDVATLQAALEKAASMSESEYFQRSKDAKESLVFYLPKPGFYTEEFRKLLTR